MRAKRYTVKEANDMIPRLPPMLHDLAEALHERRFAIEQIDDLHRTYGLDIAEGGHPALPELLRFKEASDRAEKRAQKILTAFADLGIEVKDPFIGLVDFRADRGDETVYLCWKVGEERITHWHPVEEGFEGRKPLSEF